MRYKSLVLLALVLVIICFACRKKAPTEWDVDVVAPVINGELNITNFLGDSLFQSDNTGLLHLNINRTLTSLKLDTLIKIPDTLITSGFTWTLFPVSITPGQSLIQGVQQPLKFNFSNGIALRTIVMESGFLKVVFKNTYSQPVDFRYLFPGIVKNGVPLEIIETIAGNETVGRSKIYDLKGYTLDMKGNGGQVNTLTQTYSVNANPSGQTATIQPNQGVTLDITYDKLKPNYIEGYFGQQFVTIGPDSAKLDIAKSLTAKNFKLNSAKVEFKIINDFGCELSAQLFNIYSVNKVNTTTVNLNAAALSNINVNGATKTGQWYSPYTASIKQIVLDNSNSNIKQVLEVLPDYLKYSGSVNVNPLGNTGGFNDFAYLNSSLRLDANIDIPISFNADYFDLTTTSSLDLSKIKQIDNINFGKFIIKTINGFPFKAKLQAYLVDSLNNTVDSVFNASNNMINGGQLNSQNVVVSPFPSDLNIPVDKAKLDNLKKARKLKIMARLIMPPNPPDIKLLENYRLLMKIVVDINYNIRP